MTKKEVIKYLKDKRLFDNFEVSKLGTGTNYDVFLIIDKLEKYVLRVARKNVATENKLRNEFYFLKFLQEQKIDFVQKPIFYDVRKRISILTFIPGKEVSVSELTDSQLKIFIQHIIRLHEIKIQKYKTFSKKHNLKLILPETPLQSINKYGVARFNYVKKNCSDDFIKNWIEPKLQHNLQYIKKGKWTSGKIILNHNDLAGSNIIVNKERVSFIDWEHARFVYNTGTGIGVRHIQNYDKGSSDKLIKRIISLYNKYSKKSIKIKQKDIDNNAKVYKLNDIIWAAQTFAKMKIDKNKDWIKYKKLTYERIGEYEKMFNKK